MDKARILAGETPHATQYGTARGLTGSLRVNTCNYMAPDGSLYLATRNGVSVFDFREISAPMPPLVINSIRVDGRTYEPPERLTLGSDARRMTIRFSALTYSGATDLCIGYELVSFAQNETVLDNTASGAVSYTNLDGGTYTFCLRVFDPNDHTAVGQTLKVTIVKEKKLTEQPLFWAAGIAALVLLSVGTAH